VNVNVNVNDSGEGPDALPPPPRAPLGRASKRDERRSHQARVRLVRRILGALLLGGLGAAVVVAALPEPVFVDLAKATRGPLVITVDEPGRTRVRDRYVVSAPLGGELGRIELRPGDAVQQGAVLARLVPANSPLLDPRSRAEATARLATARSALEQSRAAVSRASIAQELAAKERDQQRTLAATGSVSRNALDQMEFQARLRTEELASARFGAKMAEHEVEMARAALARHSAPGEKGQDEFAVPSPAAGRVLRVLAPNAGVVQTGTPLVELGDPAALEIVADVLTADAVRIPERARVTLKEWGGPDLAAHVRLVEPSAFTRVSALGVEEQRVSVVIDLDEPRTRWAALGDGYRVETRIVIWEHDAVLTVPSSAVFRGKTGWAVFVLEGGRARLRPVEVGQRGGALVEIAKGLTEGEAVVVHPSEAVADGVRVERR
jgi:HlyD family secretion protein